MRVIKGSLRQYQAYQNSNESEVPEEREKGAETPFKDIAMAGNFHNLVKETDI